MPIIVPMPIFRMPVVLHANYPHANSLHTNYPGLAPFINLDHDDHA